MGRGGVAGVLALVITGWTAVGCDGTRDCGNGCWQPTAADQSFITSLCGFTAACCASNSFSQSLADVPSICVTGLGRSGVSGDPYLQAACLSEMQSLAGSASCTPDVNDLSDPCVRVLHEPSGPQPPGGSCKTADDCAGAPGTITRCLPASGVGVCIRFARGSAGEHTCLADLQPGGLETNYFRIDFQNGTHRVPSGVFCARADGLYCVQTDDATTSVCTPLIGDGAPCNDVNGCASGTCEMLTSAVIGGTCAHTVTTGASCGLDVCDDASYCTSATPTVSSTFVCTTKQPAGTACTQQNQCASGVCNANLCSPETAYDLDALTAVCLGWVIRIGRL